VSEPGLDIHQRETRWADLQEQTAGSPDEALPDLVRLIEEMLTERGFDLEDTVVEEGQDADVVRSFQAARDISRAAETTKLEREDLDAALEDLQEIHDFLIEGRAPP
jgi:N-acetyl-anhydromuramyl-L-alanine amidase AmpD